MEQSTRPLRRDAARNRRLILEAATELFAERGLSVSLDQIARRAGVGVGTVYRRFADKEELIDSLFEQRLEGLAAAARAAANRDDPWEGLRSWLAEFVRLQVEDRGLKEVILSGSRRQARLAAARSRLLPPLRELLRRAQDQGKARRDLNVVDLLLVCEMVAGVAAEYRSHRPTLYRRYVNLLLDGMAAARPLPSPLGEPPFSEEEAALAKGLGPEPEPPPDQT